MILNATKITLISNHNSRISLPHNNSELEIKRKTHLFGLFRRNLGTKQKSLRGRKQGTERPERR